MLDQLLLFLGSFIANTMSALAGGGTGLVQFPLLIFLGLPFSVALATHKVATVALGLGATYRHLKHKQDFDWRLAVYVALSGVLGTILGAYIIIQVPERAAELTLGIITVAIGVYSTQKKQMGEIANPKNRNLKGNILGGLVLFLIGVFNGSITSGSGLFVTVWLITWFGLDFKTAVMYTMVFVGLLWNSMGAITIVTLGQHIQWNWMPALLLGSFIGGYAGTHLALLKGSVWVKRAFEIVAILSGLALIVRAL